jgi:UDP-3-O-[3-hydroxymyristoyl] N-acetylglucosamine deacetylase
VKYQTTIADRIELDGIGVHSGNPVSITITPADPDTGIVFQRSDLDELTDLPATVDYVGATDLCTVLGNPAHVCVKTIEHLMAAFSAMEIDNAIVEVDDSELPVMDGSSLHFIEAFDQVGLIKQARKRRYIKVKKPIRVAMGASWAEFTPYDGRRFEVEIDFDAPIIGRQSYKNDLTPSTFRDELSGARTFGFMKDVEGLWAAGYALGSSLDNSVVIGDDNTIVNPEGLRYEDEFVRHKTLDAVGDLALSGLQILGCYRSYRGGHKMNAMAVEALLKDKDAYEIVTADDTPIVQDQAGASVSISAAVLAPERL